MAVTDRWRAPVRRELGFAGPTRGRRVVRSAALAVVLVAVLATPATAQEPWRQEAIPGLASLDAGRQAAPDLVDLDGDGDRDVVAGTQDGDLVFFENTGGSRAPAFVGRFGAANPFDAIQQDFGDPAFVDLDGDGDLDLGLGTVDGRIRYFENTGSPLRPAFLERTGAANPFDGAAVTYVASPAFVDLDDDGDYDAAVGGYDGYYLGGAFHYFENVGTSSGAVFVERFGAQNPLPVPDDCEADSPDLVDLDGDGDFDILAADHFNMFCFFENTGDASQAAFVERTGTANPFWPFGAIPQAAPDLADLDGDGDLDALVGDYGGALVTLWNTGGASAPAFLEPPAGASPTHHIDVVSLSVPSLADLDGDGDLDAIVGGVAGTLRYLENTGGPGAPRFAERFGTDSPTGSADLGITSTPEIADLDGDDDLDLVVGVREGTLAYLENTGTPTAPGFVVRIGPSNPLDAIDIGLQSRPALGDLDGDGDLDLAVGEFYGSVHYFENVGADDAPSFVERTGTASPLAGVSVGNAASPEIVDWDGDGDLDLVLGERAGLRHYYENVGGSQAASFVERTGSANPLPAMRVGGYSTPNVVDLDSDGDLDLSTGETHGKIVFFRRQLDLFADGFESGDTSAWSATVP